jgi:plastocyanin
MLSKDEDNNKAVFAALVLTLLSLSLASSIAIITPHYTSAQEVTGQAGGNATNATMTGAGNATNATMTGAGNATNATMTGAGNATNATMTGAGNATNATMTGAGNATTSVSIVSGASTLTTDAFSPNPIQVSVGSTVTWTNNDAQAHTVNSGDSPTQSGLFDSPIMAPQATFEYTFTEAGEVPYFCILHPNMVGTVSVS